MVTEAKKIIRKSCNLVKIFSQYSCLAKLTIQMESFDYTIEQTVVETLFSINFREDECRIKDYLLKRLKKMTLLLLRI